MKTLYLVRHAKASWKHDVDDHKRPLKKRGQKDGKIVSEKVAEVIQSPDMIISSDAIRALSTAYFFKDSFRVSEQQFQATAQLYDFRGTGVFELIKNLNDDTNRVMLVGHNHAFTTVANMLGDVYIDIIPTCGFVEIVFNESSWKTITTGKTGQIIFPKYLKNG